MYIKPCPFCGGEPIINVITVANNLPQRQNYYSVACLDCNVSQCEYQHRNHDDAINAWNERKDGEQDDEARDD